ASPRRRRRPLALTRPTPVEHWRGARQRSLARGGENPHDRAPDPQSPRRGQPRPLPARRRAKPLELRHGKPSRTRPRFEAPLPGGPPPAAPRERTPPSARKAQRPARGPRAGERSPEAAASPAAG